MYINDYAVEYIQINTGRAGGQTDCYHFKHAYDEDS